VKQALLPLDFIAKDKSRKEPAKRARVLLPLPFEKAFDYAIPNGMLLEIGDFVEVPFRNRKIIGVVWELPQNKETAGFDLAKIKNISCRYDIPSLPSESKKFVQWVAKYTLAPLGAVLKLILSAPDAFTPPKARSYKYLRNNPVSLDRTTPQRQRVLDLWKKDPNKPFTLKEIQELAQVGSGVVRNLVGKDLLTMLPCDGSESFSKPKWHLKGPKLSKSQKEAAQFLHQRLEDKKFSVTLIDGVTGSGKTEVYFEAIGKALQSGKQCLVLLPEIALSAQWLKRFEKRFGAKPLVWHSDLTPKQRRDNWRLILQGKAQVAVGARSALFLPFPNLGLIIIDEEHESSYKQEEGVIYHGRDMAIVRAQMGKFPIILASATPSLESIVNVQQEKYQMVTLPGRHGSAQLPTVYPIDMREHSKGMFQLAKEEKTQAFISPPLREKISETLDDHQQVLLFLNRRGYAPLTLCRACGYRFTCPNCSAWLIDHKRLQNLQCHHCGHHTSPPSHCPECTEENSFVACGPGVERIAEEISRLYPEKRTEILTSDTLSSPKKNQELIQKIQNHEIDIIIGTQVIAKGHHFPQLTLVGVIDSDLGLSGGDPRASEKTYQVLHQVSGRCGREEKPGRVYLQTYFPENSVISALASHDRDGFIEHEILQRQWSHMPPFGKLVAFILTGPFPQEVEACARALARHAPSNNPDIQIMGPAPAPLSLIGKRYRWRLLMKAKKEISVQGIVQQWVHQIKIPPKVRLHIDIDPQSFL
jgi:primosomal protein N' (replication factor Y) (superfamily II helicase)